MALLPAAPRAPGPIESSIWRNRMFLIIWLGNTISIIGDGFHSVALGLWVLHTTNSAAAMGSIMATRIIVGVLLGAVAGTVCDRTDRRRLMIGMNLMRTVLVLGVAYLIASGHGGLPGVISVTALIAICGAFFDPAFNASLVNIVDREQLGKASSLLQLTKTVAQVMGPLLAGVVVETAGGAVALCVDAASFFVGGVAILLGGSFASPHREGQRSTFVQDLTAGFAYIKQEPLLRALITAAPLLNFFGSAFFMLLPVVAVKNWHVTSGQFGLLGAVIPTGFAACTAVMIGRIARMRRRGQWMCGTFILDGLLITSIMIMPNFMSSLPLIFAIGAGMAMANIIFQTLMQTEIADEVKGRVFGTFGSLAMVASPAAVLIGGLLADLFTPVQVGVGFGLLLTLAGISVALAFPAIRNYR